jgi:hypothetical protein
MEYSNEYSFVEENTVPKKRYRGGIMLFSKRVPWRAIKVKNMKYERLVNKAEQIIPRHSPVFSGFVCIGGGWLQSKSLIKSAQST